MPLFLTDLDGTLEDSRLDMALAVNRSRAAWGLPGLGIESLKANVNRGTLELVRHAFSDILSHEDHPHALEQELRVTFEQEYLSHCCVHSRCYPGIPEALEFLSQAGPVAVVTNKPQKISEELLRQLGILRFISLVVGGDKVAENKPSPLPLQVAVQSLGFTLNGNRAYMIGDTNGDLKAGRALGVTTVWCSWGYVASTEIAPDLVVNHPLELKRLAMG